MAESDERIFAAVGIHPNEAQTWDSSTQQEITSLANHPRVVAIGEIGLDFYRDHAPRDLQIEILTKQLEISADLQLPVILHNRDAMQPLWSILAEWHHNLSSSGNPLQAHPGVCHAYSDDLFMAAKLMEKSFFIGIGGPVTFTNAAERQITLSGLPLAAILLETDAPYLAPHPHRGRRNEPAYVALVAQKVAELQRVPVTQVAEITSNNANRLFDWRNHS